MLRKKSSRKYTPKISIDNFFWFPEQMRPWLLCLINVTFCWLGAFAACLPAVDPPSDQRAERQKISQALMSPPANSAASCAATACHGGPRPGVNNPLAWRGSEYAIWLNRDPHAQAYRSLSSPLGTQILERLNILQTDRLIDPAGLKNCLACHSSHSDSLTDARELNREGVSCEQCHGSSQTWRTKHYSMDWPVEKTRAANLNFIDNTVLLTRARMCTSCHVGGPGRNMNHDMLAAGHPPLLFEFTTYHHRLPKHWRERRSRDTDYESTLWLVGQIAALEAQVALIKSRASTHAGKPSPWPEFAHLDCASCHRSLPDSTAPWPARQSSQAGWSHWNRWGIEAMLHQTVAHRDHSARWSTNCDGRYRLSMNSLHNPTSLPAKSPRARTMFSSAWTSGWNYLSLDNRLTILDRMSSAISWWRIQHSVRLRRIGRLFHSSTWPAWPRGQLGATPSLHMQLLKHFRTLWQIACASSSYSHLIHQ